MAKVDQQKFPNCDHAGNQLTGRRFCRRADRPRLVDFETCNGCLHDQTPTVELLPSCQHRGERVESIISCQCPRSWQKGVFECSKHGRCVLSSHNREEMPGVKCCETCRDCHTQEPDVDLSELAIIAVHFNPQRYALPVRNYWQWRHHLGPLEKQLTTIELSFDGHFTIHDAVKIGGTAANLMWQKEALINAAARQLLETIKYVAWIDHDLIFGNESWAVDALAKLQGGFDVVQLFDGIDYQDKHGSVFQSCQAFVASHQDKRHDMPQSAPGGAWAARRDYFDRVGGLPTTNIVGGGDQLACDAWLDFDSHYQDRYSGPLAADAVEWKQHARAAMRGKCGYIAGRVTHLYHGERSNRGYVERAEFLHRGNFDPETDIRINSDGLLEWASNKPQLHQDVASYFASRREDD